MGNVGDRNAVFHHVLWSSVVLYEQMQRVCTAHDFSERHCGSQRNYYGNATR